jgi:hypothetical protein
MARQPKEQRAKARVEEVDLDVACVNEKYALVMVGDKPVVMSSSDGLRMMSYQSFGQWIANKFVVRNERKKPLAKHWMEHRQRRQYDGIVFDPSGDAPRNYYNMWRGFAVESKAGGDCSKFLTHVQDNICRGEKATYDWVLGWFAQMFQQPSEKMGTSLAIIGPQGTGKTIVGQIMGSLLGPHHTIVADPRYVYGRFNAHLVSTILLQIEEAIWAGDKKAEGQLKDLITGKTQNIEYKGKEIITVANFIRCFICSNNPWVVSAGFGERRSTVLHVGEEKMQDKKYFGAIVAEMGKPGAREALLHYLLNFDLTKVDLRTVLKTDALLEQKDATLDSEQSWWLDMLARGELPWGCVEPRCAPAIRIFDSYIRSASRQGYRRRSSETLVGTFLKKQVPGLKKNIDGRYKRVTRNGLTQVVGSTYVFPSLSECRSAFASMMQQDREWGAKTEWTKAPLPDEDDEDTGGASKYI